MQRRALADSFTKTSWTVHVREKKKGGQHLSGKVYFFLNVLHEQFQLRTGRLTRLQQPERGLGKKKRVKVGQYL